MGRRLRSSPTGCAFALLALFTLPTHCKRKAAPPAIDERAACASACAALTSAGCERTGLRRDDHARCVDECTRRASELRPASCDAPLATYLTCVARKEPECPKLACSAASCLEHAIGLEACKHEHSQWRKCIAPCLNPGSMQTGERSVRGASREQRVQAEVVRAGCVACPAPAAGAPENSACQSASVCSQVCCRCPDGAGRYLARACVDGSCAAAETACTFVRGAVSPDPCAP